MKKSFFLVFLIGILFAACPIVEFQPSEKSYFVLKHNKKDKNGDGKEEPKVSANKGSLLVKATTANPLISSRKIIFSTDEVSRGYYRYSFWVEPPTRAFFDLLVRDLEERKVFDVVSKSSSAIAGDFQLNTEILSFFHDARKSPGKVIVQVRAQLIDLSTLEVIGKRVFRDEKKVEEYNAKGAVKAFSKSIGSIIDSIHTWLVGNPL